MLSLVLNYSFHLIIERAFRVLNTFLLLIYFLALDRLMKAYRRP